jgi:hypothetical protein
MTDRNSRSTVEQYSSPSVELDRIQLIQLSNKTGLRALLDDKNSASHASTKIMLEVLGNCQPKKQ